MKKNSKVYIISFITLILVMFTGMYLIARYVRHLSSELKKTNELVVEVKNISQLVDYTITYKKQKESLSRLDFIDDSILERGGLAMKDKRALFVGITRDNGDHISGSIALIESVGKKFKEYKAIIFENDSTDSTKKILSLWKSNNKNVKVLNKSFGIKKRPSILFLAKVRNFYVDEINKTEYDDYDYVFVVDMDMSYGIDVRGVQDSFSKSDRWDVVCSNGISSRNGEMYDAFAFRNDEFPYSPAEYKKKFGKSYWKQYVQTIQKIYSPQDDMIEVDSCFNGLAIYKKNLFRGCKYDSVEEDCEHIFLHKCMKGNYDARIFMNPAQVIRYLHYNS